MKQLEVFAQITLESGNPASGLVVRLETFLLRNSRWISLGEASTDRDGCLRLEAAWDLGDTVVAPQVRLSLAGEPEGRVLSEGGRLAYAKTSGRLSIDFGAITYLNQEVPAPASPERRFQAQALSLAGAARPALEAAVRPTLKSLGAEVTRLVRVKQDLELKVGKQDLQVLQLREDAAGARRQADEAARGIQAAAETTRAVQLRLGETEAELARVTKDRDRLIQAAASEGRSRIPIARFTEDLQAQLGDAQARLDRSEAGLRLGDVRIRVRGKLDAAGTLELGGLDKLPAKGGVLDEIEISFNRPDAGTDAAESRAVPDLTRLTESAARQVLLSLGLRLDGAVAPCEAGCASGQAMRQVPSPGVKAAPGSSVFVVFAQ